MRYVLARHISHADVDFLGELKVSALLGMLEQAAVEASSRSGFDAARYALEKRVWIIRRTRLRRLRAVGGTDEIRITTQVEDVRRARSLRSYAVHCGADSVAEASTDWVYCDMQSGRPMRIPSELHLALSGGIELPALPRAGAFAPVPSAAAAGEITVAVRPSDLDHVVHVNNGIYTNYLEDGAFELFAQQGWDLMHMLAHRGALRIEWLDCEYLENAQLGDQLTVRSWLIEPERLAATVPAGAHVRQSIVRGDGRELLHAETRWTWRHRSPVLGAPPAAGPNGAQG
jgi:acyl-CoA thioester hydrolase